ncbi:MAG: fimbrillin family protein, partial [Paramuribaculum sp.]|nr:fimbrillin family protein [Paramuribaculum sp.]
LKFRHILSRVTFSAKTDDRYLGSDGNPVRRLRIIGFKLNGIARHGNWEGDAYGKDGSTLGAWTVTGQSDSYTAVIPDDGIAIGNTPVRLFDGDNVILAIPQAFEAAQAEIEYSYTDEPTVVHTAVAELSGTWLPGKSYSYSFTINAHIFFDTPKVDDWVSAPVNGPDLDIKLPI